MSPFYIHSVYDDLEPVVWMYTSGTKHFFIALFFWPKRIFTPKKLDTAPKNDKKKRLLEDWTGSLLKIV